MSPSKVDQFTSSEHQIDQNDHPPIPHMSYSWNTCHQWKCFLFVIMCNRGEPRVEAATWPCTCLFYCSSVRLRSAVMTDGIDWWIPYLHSRRRSVRSATPAYTSTNSRHRWGTGLRCHDNHRKQTDDSRRWPGRSSIASVNQNIYQHQQPVDRSLPTSTSHHVFNDLVLINNLSNKLRTLVIKWYLLYRYYIYSTLFTKMVAETNKT